MNKEKKKENIRNAAISGASSDVVQRYGSANKEFLKAYSGIDNETGQRLTKSLKSIHEQKVHPDYANQNLKQQAGFDAEVLDAAKNNAEERIKGSGNTKIRTDDFGSVNDPLYDHVWLDKNGNPIPGSGSQMKFVGSSPEEALKKLQSKKFEKYLENDAKIDVPSDYYDAMMKEASSQIDKLEKQIADQSQKGNTEKVAQLKKKLENVKKIKKNMQKSSVSTKEAMFARNHPKLATAKEIGKVSHRAGMESAGIGAAVGGGISIIQNLVAVVKGEKDGEEALMCVARDTASSAVVGYGTGFAGSAIKGLMQNAKNGTIQALSKTNLPGTIVTVAVGATKTLASYFKGEIDGVECFEQLGEQGTGMVASAMFATIGQALIPIPVVGGMIGGMIGYALSSAFYGILTSSLKEAKLAKEERLQIEKACEEHIALIKAYRAELEAQIAEYLNSYMDTFHEAFTGIKTSLQIGDIDGYIAATNTITKAMGKEVLFETQNEFDKIMMDDDFVIKI